MEAVLEELEKLYDIELLLKKMPEDDRNQLIGKIELLREIRSRMEDQNGQLVTK